ncbi:AAA family ATPase [Streptomyces sp. NPDC091272]|uniref:helix-turn-helix transcriptional regulator n=1 Tax=Streptomyces sp. NPDC091272 TaxID=3365981 RepID=UPI0037F43A26
MRQVDRDDAERFVGRQAELGTLMAALAEAAPGRVTRRILTGEPGAGRTALLNRYVRLAEDRGHTVVHLTGQPGVAPWRHAIAAQLGLSQRILAEGEVEDEGDRESVTAGAAGAASGGGGGGGAWGGGGVGCRPMGADVDGHRSLPASAALAIDRALAGLAPAGALVLAVDDLDLAGPEALPLLDELARARDGVPVVQVVTLQEGRSARLEPEVARLLVNSRTIHLGGLSAPDSALLVQRMTRLNIRPATLTAFHRVCAGNPRLLVELLHDFAANSREYNVKEVESATLPASTENVMRLLARNHPGAAGVLTAAAIVGDRSEPRLLAHLSDLDLPDAMRAADRLVRMRLLQDDGGLQLRHPVLRSSLLAAMTHMARDAAHLKAAAYLHQMHAPVEDIAAQLIASGTPLDATWCTPLLLEAGRLASADGRGAAALAYVEHAARTASGPERDRTLVVLTDVRMADGLPEGIEQGLTALKSVTEEESRSKLLARLGAGLYLRAPQDSGADALQLVVRTAASHERNAWAALHRILVNEEHHAPTDLAERTRRLRSSGHLTARTLGVRVLPERLRPAADATALYQRYLAGADPGPLVTEVERLLVDEERVCTHPVALMNALMVLAWTGRYDSLACHVENFENCGLSRGNALQGTLLLSVKARVSFARGNVREACEQFAECLERLTLIRTAAHNPLRLGVVAAYVQALLESGDHRAAERLLRENTAAEEPPGWSYGTVLLARSAHCLTVGDFTGALRHLYEARRRAQSAGIAARAVVPWRLHGISVMDQLGRKTEARAWATEEVAGSAAAGSDLEHGVALRALGSVLGGPEGERSLRHAVRLLEGAGARLELAHATADLGTAVADEGRWDEAGAILASALSLADACGAAPLTATVRQRLTALGGDSTGQLALRAAAALTVREKQVLVGAVRGHSNTSLAADLHITKRTVEIHLSSAYRKLAIRGRKDFDRIFRVPGLWAVLLQGEGPLT